MELRGVFFPLVSFADLIGESRNVKNWIRWSSQRMTAMVILLSIFFVEPTLASTTNNLYDVNGHLIASCSNESGCSYLVYKGLSQAGTIKAGKYKHYLTGPQGKLAVIDKVPSNQSMTMTWLNTDFHHSVMVSSVGNTPQQNMLDAFWNDLQPESSSAKEKIYTDKHQVENAKSLYNFNARFYDPEIGRFTITDPIAQDNLNWFTYAANNPILNIDPDGRDPEAIRTALDVARVASERVVAAGLDAYQAAHRVDELNQAYHALSTAFNRNPTRELEAQLNRVADLTGRARGYWESMRGEVLLREVTYNQALNNVRGMLRRAPANEIQAVRRMADYASVLDDVNSLGHALSGFLKWMDELVDYGKILNVMSVAATAFEIANAAHDAHTGAIDNFVKIKNKEAADFRKITGDEDYKNEDFSWDPEK